MMVTGAHCGISDKRSGLSLCGRMSIVTTLAVLALLLAAAWWKQEANFLKLAGAVVLYTGTVGLLELLRRWRGIGLPHRPENDHAR